MTRRGILLILPALALLSGACSTLREATTHETFKEVANDAIHSVQEDFSSKPSPQPAPKTP